MDLKRIRSDYNTLENLQRLVLFADRRCAELLRWHLAGEESLENRSLDLRSRHTGDRSGLISASLVHHTGGVVAIPDAPFVGRGRGHAPPAVIEEAARQTRAPAHLAGAAA